MDLTIEQAIAGFLLARQVEGCSPNTLRNYSLDLRRFAACVGAETPLASITSTDLRRFLGQLQTARIAPAGVAPRPAAILSPKTITNTHTTLRSLWRWAVAEGYAAANVAAEITPPRPASPAIQPLTREEVHALLRAVDQSRPYRDRPGTRNSRPADLRRRDRAILLLLLDTGVRASELCRLAVGDYNQTTGALIVRGKSRLNSGQGQQRIVYIETLTRKALWAYLVRRSAPPDAPLIALSDAPLIALSDGGVMQRRHLALHLRRLGSRAEVRNVHPHRFRHTFAIAYLRNGGDPYTLQKLLGHSSLDMVKRYLAIAQADCAAVHRRCSPVENWL